MVKVVTIDFVVDSGATHHYVNNEAFLFSCKRLKYPFDVNVAKAGQSLKARVGGQIHMVSYPTEREKVELTLKEAFFTPDLEHNLFSVRRVEAAGGEVLFSNGTVTVKNRGTVVAVGK